MSDKSKIEWTDATPMVDRNGTRIRFYERLDPSRPGQQLRRQMAAQGLKWCRSCEEWLPADKVDRGLCRPHANEAYRAYYDEGGKTAIRQRVHARKRGVAPVPVIGIDYLLEQFDGTCAYCHTRPGNTWDHVIPVATGGETVPGNVVPACCECNSSKKDSDVWEWIERKGLPFPHGVFDVIALLEVH